MLLRFYMHYSLTLLQLRCEQVGSHCSRQTLPYSVQGWQQHSGRWQLLPHSFLWTLVDIKVIHQDNIYTYSVSPSALLWEHTYLLTHVSEFTRWGYLNENRCCWLHSMVIKGTATMLKLRIYCTLKHGVSAMQAINPGRSQCFIYHRLMYWPWGSCNATTT